VTRERACGRSHVGEDRGLQKLGHGVSGGSECGEWIRGGSEVDPAPKGVECGREVISLALRPC